SFASAFLPGSSRRYHAAPAPPATRTTRPTTSSSFPFPLFGGASASAAVLSSAIASSPRALGRAGGSATDMPGTVEDGARLRAPMARGGRGRGQEFAPAARGGSDSCRDGCLEGSTGGLRRG